MRRVSSVIQVAAVAAMVLAGCKPKPAYDGQAPSAPAAFATAQGAAAKATGALGA